jgi:hypothetical protein
LRVDLLGAGAKLRWREEQARVERLERLATVWRRNRELRVHVSELREAIGIVDATSELSQWLAWAADYAGRSDPLKPLRERSSGKLTLYYHGYDHDRIAR